MVGSTPTGGTMRKVPRSESKRTTEAASLHWQPGKTGKCAAAQTLLALRKDGVRMGSTQRCFANGPSNAVPGGRRGSQNLSGRGQFPPTAKHVRSFPGVVQLSRRCRGNLPPWCSGSTSAFQAERAGSSPVGGSSVRFHGRKQTGQRGTDNPSVSRSADSSLSTREPLKEMAPLPSLAAV